jgi:hypothetical protein
MAANKNSEAAGGNLMDGPEKSSIPNVRDPKLEIVNDRMLIDVGADETRAQKSFGFRREKENFLGFEVH